MRYLAYQEPRMKLRNYAELKRHLESHAKPLHTDRVRQVTQRSVVDLLQRLAKTAPVAANRVRGSLFAMFA